MCSKCTYICNQHVLTVYNRCIQNVQHMYIGSVHAPAINLYKPCTTGVQTVYIWFIQGVQHIYRKCTYPWNQHVGTVYNWCTNNVCIKQYL